MSLDDQAFRCLQRKERRVCVKYNHRLATKQWLQPLDHAAHRVLPKFQCDNASPQTSEPVHARIIDF